MTPTTRHLTWLDRRLIQLSGSPALIVVLMLAAVGIDKAYEHYQASFPSYTEEVLIILGIVLLAFHRNVVSLCRGNGFTVLLLRRFHTEKLPAYPLSRSLHRMVERGYQVVTLRDSIVDVDHDTLGGLIFVVETAMFLLGVMCCVSLLFGTAVLLFYGNFALAHANALPLEWSLVFGAVEFPLAFFAWRRIFRDGGAVEGRLKLAAAWCSMRVRILFSRKARVLAGPLQKLRFPGQLAMTVVRAEDATWLQDVGSLMDRSDAVIVDLSDPSSNIQLEIVELGRRQDRCVPIWLRAANQPSAIVRQVDGYSVLSTVFRGIPVEAIYPARASKLDYATGVMAALNPSEFLAAATLSATVQAAIARQQAGQQQSSVLQQVR